MFRASVLAVLASILILHAKTIAQLFVADGEIVSEEGQSTQGREAIEQLLAELGFQVAAKHPLARRADGKPGC